MNHDSNRLEKLIAKIAELRDVFPFDKDRDYNNGYSYDKKDGWHDEELMHSPEFALDAMIRCCGTNAKNEASNDILPLVTKRACSRHYISNLHCPYPIVNCKKCPHFK